MTVDTDKLKALALAATKGPWMRLFGERTVYDRMEDGCRGNAIVRADVAFSKQGADNLDFIAAANPATVLELIAEVERLRADAARYQHMRQAQWFKAGFAKTEANASAFHYGGELLDQLVDAAIEARTQTSEEGS